MYAWSGARGTRRTARESEARAAARAVRLLCLGLLLPLLSAMTVLAVRLGPDGLMLGLAYPAYALLRQAEPLPETVETLAPRSPEPLSVSAQAKAGSSVSPAGQAELPDAAAPRILIYHTHATEAYLNTSDAPYEESGDWRTRDASRSVVAVGALLKTILEEQYGLSVLHDTTNHEPPKLSTAYSRSLLTMQTCRERYPGIQLYIDVHRDAYGKPSEEPKDFVVIDGKETARLMFVVGTGEGATGAGFAEMPDFDGNYALALAVTERMEQVDDGLTRDVRIKTGRYNQHMGRCLLVEVGHNANTLEQAFNAVPHLAAALWACVDFTGAKTAPALPEWAPQA